MEIRASSFVTVVKTHRPKSIDSLILIWPKSKSIFRRRRFIRVFVSRRRRFCRRELKATRFSVPPSYDPTPGGGAGSQNCGRRKVRGVKATMGAVEAANKKSSRVAEEARGSKQKFRLFHARRKGVFIKRVRGYNELANSANYANEWSP